MSERVPTLDSVPPLEWDATASSRYLPDASANEAYWQGAWAYGFGLEEDANPYPNEHPAREAWMNGWIDSSADCGG